MATIHSHPRRASAIGLAVASLLLSVGAQAGVINNSNPDTASGAFLGDCGTVGNAVACIGALNLDNVSVKVVSPAGADIGTFDPTSGVYTGMTKSGDTFVSSIQGAAVDSVMAKLTGKVWPIGEPVGIKAVYGDTKVKNGKPQNCLINTAFLSPEDSVPEGAAPNFLTAYLDSQHPKPVICSSPFQSHKRFKLAMQPDSVAGAADGVEGAEGKPIDLVFNVTNGVGLESYQVFSKINNYTDKRLSGYKIVVGTGKGDSFKPSSDITKGGVGADKLHISLGVAEGWSSGSKGGADGSDLFKDDGLATFSHGLFGVADIPKHPTDGFFDTRTAGFNVAQTCTVEPCNTFTNPNNPSVGDPFDALTESDTIVSTTKLLSNYTEKFGDWLPSKWQPMGVFYDEDANPDTDNVLMAYWDGTQWVGGNKDSFAPIPQATLDKWAMDKAHYPVDSIEDVLNLGINYIVKVGDDIGTDITIRIIPLVAADQSVPVFVTNPAPKELPLPVTPPAATGGGGGCTAASGNAPFDPVLPLLAALGLAGWGLRRVRRG